MLNSFWCTKPAQSDSSRPKSMSLLTAVEEAIKSYKAEQARINESSLRYKEIIQSIAPHPEKGSQDSECTEDAAADISTGEKEEIELLERALEKALRVRAGTEISKNKSNRDKQSGPLKEQGGTDVKPKRVTQASEACKGNQTTARATTKSTSLGSKEKPGVSISSKLGSRTATGHSNDKDKSKLTKNHPVSSAETVHRQAAYKAQQVVSTSGSLVQGQVHISTSKCKAFKSKLSGEDPDKAATTSHSDETGKQSLHQQNRIPSEEAVKWKSLIIKQNRLWDKVMAVQRKPVPGRSHFMERMRATFPKDLAYGAPDQSRGLVDQLSHQGHDPSQHFQTKELLAKQAAEGGTKSEGQAWNRWWAEGAGLCPTGAKGDGMIAPLPLTVTYTTEAELRELEKLRMRVELLQQEICLEQALWDTLSPQLSSVICGPVCPSPSVLRDIYSLLGEGGHKFPAIVLDTEPD